jgi:uncharacterized DUF497 family protein
MRIGHHTSHPFTVNERSVVIGRRKRDFRLLIIALDFRVGARVRMLSCRVMAKLMLVAGI